MTIDEVKGNEVKILWICGLFGLLSLVAYGRITTTLSDRALAQSATWTSPTGVMPPTVTGALDTPAGISRTAARSMPALATAASAASNPAVPDLALYLQLHETRAVEVLPVSGHANLCPG
jgi:hypothetical protein